MSDTINRIIKDLGAVSSYAVAVEHGFTGTEQDWIDLITGSTSSAQIAVDSATASQSWAVGGTNSRTGEDTDNAKYYAEQAQHSSENLDWENVINKPNTLSGYGVTEVPSSSLRGMIDPGIIPKEAKERVYHVKTDLLRFSLTTLEVQNGDVVKVESTGKMYYVVDDTKLSTENGYDVFHAGAASSVPWSGVENKPTTISGYGITNAYTKTEVDEKLAQKETLCEEMTFAEYNALTNDQKMDGTIRFITDI